MNKLNNRVSNMESISAGDFKFALFFFSNFFLLNIYYWIAKKSSNYSLIY